MTRLAFLLLPLLAACSGKDDETDDKDTESPQPEDTYVEESDPPVGGGLDTDDTGAVYTIAYEGRATVARNVSFTGTQALAAVWLKNGVTPGKPRCIYVQEVVDWEHDPARGGAPNPLSASAFDQCPQCEFAFTISLVSTVRQDFFPWSDPDPDDGIDPPPDIVPSNPNAARRLDCSTLTGRLGFPTPEEIMAEGQTWTGIGYDVEGDFDNDPGTGVVLVWDALYGGGWSEAYTATWDSTTGAFHWKGFDRPADFPAY